MSQTVSANSVSADQLRAFLERIERMEEEKRAIADDIKEIYAEAKGNGFDPKVIRAIVRIRKMDHAERLEQEALLAIYMAALGMQAEPRFGFDDDDPPRGSRRTDDHHASALEMPRQQVVARNQFQAKASEGKAGTAPLIVAPPDGEASRTSRGVDTPATIPEAPKPLPEGSPSEPHLETPAEAKTSAQEPLSSGSGEVQDECTIHLPANSPETATETLDDLAVQDGVKMSSDGSGDLTTGHTPTWPLTPADDGQVASISPATDKPGEAHASPAPRAFIPANKPFRPHCVNPQMCGAMGNNHCHGCTKAMTQASEAA